MVPRTRGAWPGGHKANGTEARKPSHPHGRRQHRPSAGCPFSLIREIRNPSPNHGMDVELPSFYLRDQFWLEISEIHDF